MYSGIDEIVYSSLSYTGIDEIINPYWESILVTSILVYNFINTGYMISLIPPVYNFINTSI